MYRVVNRLKDSTGKLRGYTISVGLNQAVVKRGELLSLKHKHGDPINGKITSDGRLIASLPDAKYQDIVTLFHGSPNKIIHLNPNGGNKCHDFGKGFYLTPSFELAAEWSTCNLLDIQLPSYVHKYELDLSTLINKKQGDMM